MWRGDSVQPDACNSTNRAASAFAWLATSVTAVLSHHIPRSGAAAIRLAAPEALGDNQRTVIAVVARGFIPAGVRSAPSSYPLGGSGI
ncbi:protein of unknown function [Pseudomonas mediterranea]